MPIIAPIKKEKTFLQEKNLPEINFSREFMVDMMNYPALVRNIAVVGHLHHGKTTFLDSLIVQSHDLTWDLKKPQRYTDVHLIERDRGLSIKSMPMTLVMQNLNGKSYLCNFMDTPGHIDFSDEVTAALRICDGAALVVDAVEGVMANTTRIIQQLVNEKIPFFLIINKVDRLILELNLPPADAYYKLKHTIEEVNSILNTIAPNIRLSPEAGNVCFAASNMGWSFTLQSFTKMYSGKSEESFDQEAFAKRLWGDVYFDTETRRFRRTPNDTSKRSFLYFILEPLYKLYSTVIGEDITTVGKVLASLGIFLKRKDLTMDVKPLLALVCSRFFGGSEGFVSMCVDIIPSPADNAISKVIYFLKIG